MSCNVMSKVYFCLDVQTSTPLRARVNLPEITESPIIGSEFELGGLENAQQGLAVMEGKKFAYI